MNKAHLQKSIKKEIEQLEAVSRQRTLTPEEKEKHEQLKLWLAQLICQFGDQTETDDDEPLRGRWYPPRYRDDDERDR